MQEMRRETELMARLAENYGETALEIWCTTSGCWTDSAIENWPGNLLTLGHPSNRPGHPSVAFC